MAAGGSLRVIVGSLAANVAIAISKGVAAVITGSGAMLAEAIHSAADCSNQILLLIGAREAVKPPTPRYPLGLGQAAYFWSFLVALMIFTGGGVFSIYEGIHKLRHPEPVSDVWIGAVVLAVALVIEAAAAYQAYRAIERVRGKHPFFQFLSMTTDVDLVVLFAENAAAVLGLVVALAALLMAARTGDPTWDAMGSIAIGVLLCIVAIWLAREVKSLLQGESADPEIELVFREEAGKDTRVTEVLRVLTVQQGPGQVVLAAKLRFAKGTVAEDVAASINDLERRVETRRTEVQWIFVEPDLEA